MGDYLIDDINEVKMFLAFVDKCIAHPMQVSSKMYGDTLGDGKGRFVAFSKEFEKSAQFIYDKSGNFKFEMSIKKNVREIGDE